MPDSDENVYRVEAVDAGFHVIDESNRIVLVCRDQGSADEYAVLLNNAYRKGFKAGYRTAKIQA